MNYERSELDILHDDYEECQAKAMMLRFVQTVLDRRRGGGGESDDEDGEDLTIADARDKSRVESLYVFNRNAAEDEAKNQMDDEAVSIHAALAKQIRPPELYFSVNGNFLDREGIIIDEEEQRGAIELIWESSFAKLQTYADLWKGRSLAAQQFREANAVARNHMQTCEDGVRARLVGREAMEWQAKLSEFSARFSALEFGMLAQFHHMRGLRARHRNEIDNRLEGN